MKRPVVLITVGYITGIIWGLYLKISIAPVIFLFGGISHLILGKQKERKKLLYGILSFLIFAFISNTQIKIKEEKFDNLYQGMENIEITRNYYIRQKRNHI